MSKTDNGPAIVTQWVDIDREGTSMRMYVAAPADAGEATPSIVLAMHITGIDESMRRTAARFARNGFAIAIPDLYARFDAPNGDVDTDYKTFLPFAQQLEPRTVDLDLRAAAAWLRSAYPRTKSAIAGFCMGGAMTLTRAVGNRDVFTAAAVWYGAIRIDPKDIDIPLVASYGADDAGIPIDAIDALRAALSVPNDVVVYPHAGHGFCDETRGAYAQNAADDSWQRSVAFLHRYLG